MWRKRKTRQERMDVAGLHKNLLPFLFCFSLSNFSSMMCQFSVVESKSATFPTEKPRHLLDDSVLESHSPVRNHTLSSVFTNGVSIGEYPAVACRARVWLGPPPACLSCCEAQRRVLVGLGAQIRFSSSPNAAYQVELRVLSLRQCDSWSSQASRASLHCSPLMSRVSNRFRAAEELLVDGPGQPRFSLGHIGSTQRRKRKGLPWH